MGQRPRCPYRTFVSRVGEDTWVLPLAAYEKSHGKVNNYLYCTRTRRSASLRFI